jgi:hypothetical protein
LKPAELKAVSVYVFSQARGARLTPARGRR